MSCRTMISSFSSEIEKKYFMILIFINLMAYIYYLHDMILYTPLNITKQNLNHKIGCLFLLIRTVVHFFLFPSPAVPYSVSQTYLDFLPAECSCLNSVKVLHV